MQESPALQVRLLTSKKGSRKMVHRRSTKAEPSQSLPPLKRTVLDSELCILLARNMGNYGMNKVSPHDVLQRLRKRDSSDVRFLAANGRRSGNFLAERDP
jgi:hypothetical protein